MSELQNVQPMLEEAKRAASTGDLALADALLQDVSGIQEAELGPLHPELANTINNLAIVAEMEGRLQDAETYYRRAAAITSASLPADDPVVASSRKHLEDFCREHGLPLDLPAVTPIPQDIEYGSDVVANDPAIPPAPVEVAEIDVPASTSTHASDTRPVPLSDTDRSTAPAPARTRSLALVVIGLVVLVGAALVVTRPWSAHELPNQQATPAAAAPAQPAPPDAAAPTSSPSEQTQPPKAASRDDHSGAATPPAATLSVGGMSLVTAQLCQTFSVVGNWRCDPAAQSVRPGPIVLYTRVKSTRQAVLIHRWFQRDTLRKTSRLVIQANPTDGYRTYSRQTVKSGEEWRVEVRNAAGDLLYEQRVSVR
jgi:hypothetical protein